MKSSYTSRRSASWVFLKALSGISRFLVMLTLSMSPAMAFKASDYDITWTSQSADAKGSMPIGNGEIGCNVWVQGDAIRILLARTDAWYETNIDNGWVDTLLPKLGKVDITLNPSPFGSGFTQALRLQDGKIEITGGTGAAKKTVLLWVDANAPALRVEGHGTQPFTMTATIDRSWGPGVSRDIATLASGVAIYHRNPATSAAWDRATSQQKVNKANYPNPLANRTFGFFMQGTGFTGSGEGKLTSASGTTMFLSIAADTRIAATAQDWLNGVQASMTALSAVPWDKARTDHASWWSAFWDRSWITLDASRLDVNRNYVLQRFMNACAGRGNYPAKFNGSLFTFSDRRDWGGPYWLQNTRLIAWPALASGDFDMMQPFFKLYTDIIPLRKEATRGHFNHDGMYFPETMHFFGLWHPGDYGDGVKVSDWVGLHYNGTLEVLTMMLDYYAYTQDAAFFSGKLLPYAREVLRFWDVHWPRNAGKLNIFANALETYWKITNPSCDLAGLRSNLDRLLAFPGGTFPDSLRTAWQRLRGEVPDLPTFDVNGTRRLAYYQGSTPTTETKNSENPELYAVFPFRLFGVGRADLNMAVATFNARRVQPPSHDWSQDAVQAAELGLTDKAWEYTSNFLKNGTERFPAFWGGVDGTPQMCSGNVGAMGLQSMLLQARGDSILLFPAWKQEWDVCFKLHAPKNTTVEACLTGGNLWKVNVNPPSRAANVVSAIKPSRALPGVGRVASGDLRILPHGRLRVAASGEHRLTVLFPDGRKAVAFKGRGPKTYDWNPPVNGLYVLKLEAGGRTSVRTWAYQGAR